MALQKKQLIDLGTDYTDKSGEETNSGKDKGFRKPYAVHERQERGP